MLCGWPASTCSGPGLVFWPWIKHIFSKHFFSPEACFGQPANAQTCTILAHPIYCNCALLLCVSENNRSSVVASLFWQDNAWSQNVISTACARCRRCLGVSNTNLQFAENHRVQKGSIGRERDVFQVGELTLWCVTKLWFVLANWPPCSNFPQQNCKCWQKLPNGLFNLSPARPRRHLQ